MGRLTGLLGLATMLGLAYLFSSNRRAIRVKTVALGLFLQFLFALFVLRFNFGRNLLEWAGHGRREVSGVFLRRIAAGIRRIGPQGRLSSE